MTLSKLQRTCLFYLIGLVFQAVSLFLPWYSYHVQSDSAKSGWTLLLFEQWTPMYVIQTIQAELPSMTSSIIFAIGNLVYVGIGIALGISFLANSEPTQKQETMLYGFMVVGLVLSISLILLVLVTCVISGYFIPYLEIETMIDTFTITKTYSLSYGFGISIVAVGFLVVPVTQVDFSKLLSKVNQSKFRSPVQDKISHRMPNVQQLEDKYLAQYSQKEETA